MTSADILPRIGAEFIMRLAYFPFAAYYKIVILYDNIPAQQAPAENEVKGMQHSTAQLDDYRYLSLKGSREIGSGKRGTAFRLKSGEIVKVFHDNSTLEQIREERDRADLAWQLGVPSVRTYDVVATGKGYGIVFESGGDIELGTYMSQHPESLEEYMGRFAAMVRQVHAAQAPDGVFLNYKERYKRDLSGLTEYFTAREIRSLLEIVDAIPTRNTLVHGDCHPQNVMRSEADGKLRFIDLADFGCGHPIFDVGGLGLLIYNAKGNDASAREILGMPGTQCMEMWHVFLRLYYQTEDAEFLKRMEKTCAYFGTLRMAQLMSSTIKLKKTEKLIMAMLIRFRLLLHKREAQRLFSQL